MGFKRYLQRIYYNRSGGCVISIVILVMASVFIIPKLLNEKHSGIKTRKDDTKQELHKLEQKDKKDTFNLPETSLKFKNEQFYLNGKPFKIFGGSIHYFRVVPQYWEDRLKKLKAMGLNTVTT